MRVLQEKEEMVSVNADLRGEDAGPQGQKGRRKGEGVPFSLYEVGSAPREGISQLHPRRTTLEHTYALLPPMPIKPRKKQLW